MDAVTWAPKAIKDLDNVLNFISLDSEGYASLVVTRIIELAESIPDYPLSGRVVPEYEDGHIREKFYKSYRLIYRVLDEGHIQILRIFHQARKLDPEEH